MMRVLPAPRMLPYPPHHEAETGERRQIRSYLKGALGGRFRAVA